MYERDAHVEVKEAIAVYRYIEDAQQLHSHATNNELSPCSAMRARQGQHADKVETTAQKIDTKKKADWDM